MCVCPYLSLNRGVRLKTAEGGRLAALPLVDKPRLSEPPPLGDRWVSPCSLRSSWMNFSSSSSLGLCPPWVLGREGGLLALWEGSPVLPLTNRTSSSNCNVPVVEMLLTTSPHHAKETGPHGQVFKVCDGSRAAWHWRGCVRREMCLWDGSDVADRGLSGGGSSPAAMLGHSCTRSLSSIAWT